MKEFSRRDILKGIAAGAGLVITSPLTDIPVPSVGPTPEPAETSGEKYNLAGWTEVQKPDKLISEFTYLPRRRRTSSIPLSEEIGEESPNLDGWTEVPPTDQSISSFVHNPLPRREVPVNPADMPFQVDIPYVNGEQREQISREQFRDASHALLGALGCTLNKDRYNVTALEGLQSSSDFYCAILGSMSDLQFLIEGMRDPVFGINTSPVWDELDSLTWSYDPTRVGAGTIIRYPGNDSSQGAPQVEIIIGRGRNHIEEIEYGLNETWNMLLDSRALAREYPDIARPLFEGIGNAGVAYNLLYSYIRPRWSHQFYSGLFTELQDRAETHWYTDVTAGENKQVMGKALRDLDPWGNNIALLFGEHLGTLIEERGFWQHLSPYREVNRQTIMSGLAIISEAKNGEGGFPNRGKLPRFPNAVLTLQQERHLPDDQTQANRGEIYSISFADSIFPGIYRLDITGQPSLFGTRANAMMMVLHPTENRRFTRPFPDDDGRLDKFRLIRAGGLLEELITRYLVTQDHEMERELFGFVVAGNPNSGVPHANDVFEFESSLLNPFQNTRQLFNHQCRMVPGLYEQGSVSLTPEQIKTRNIVKQIVGQ